MNSSRRDGRYIQRFKPFFHYPTWWWKDKTIPHCSPLGVEQLTTVTLYSSSRHSPPFSCCTHFPFPFHTIWNPCQPVHYFALINVLREKLPSIWCTLVYAWIYSSSTRKCTYSYVVSFQVPLRLQVLLQLHWGAALPSCATPGGTRTCVGRVNCCLWAGWPSN